MARRDPKEGTGKKPKGSGRRLYTDENLETLLELSLRPLQMLVKLFQKLKTLTNRSREKYKFLRLVNREPKLWVRQRWLAYLKKEKKRLGKRGKHE